jgi:hypothetical protein
METTKYFSIHSLKAIESKQFSVICGNIQNIPEKVSLAKKLYNKKDWHFEYHNTKKDLSVMVK